MPDEPRTPPDSPRDILTPKEWRELLQPFDDVAGGKSVLVLTDRPEDAETIQAFLSPHGVASVPAQNRFTALDLFRKADFSAVVSDPRLWGEDPAAYVHRVQNIDGRVPLILILDDDQNAPELPRDVWQHVAAEARRPLDVTTLTEMFSCLGLPPLRRDLAQPEQDDSWPKSSEAEALAGAADDATVEPDPELDPEQLIKDPSAHLPPEKPPVKPTDEPKKKHPDAESPKPPGAKSGSGTRGGQRWPVDRDGEPARPPLGPEYPEALTGGEVPRPQRARMRPSAQPAASRLAKGEDPVVAMQAFLETRQDAGRLLDALKLWCEREPLLAGVAILERQGEEWFCRVRSVEPQRQQELLQESTQLWGAIVDLDTPRTIQGFHVFPDPERSQRVFAVRRRGDGECTALLKLLLQVLEPLPKTESEPPAVGVEEAIRPRDKVDDLPQLWRPRFLELLRLRLEQTPQRLALLVIEPATDELLAAMG